MEVEGMEKSFREAGEAINQVVQAVVKIVTPILEDMAPKIIAIVEQCEAEAAKYGLTLEEWVAYQASLMEHECAIQEAESQMAIMRLGMDLRRKRLDGGADE